MAQTIQVKRGLNANLGSLTLLAGEFALVTDKGKVYIGDGTNKILVNPDLGTVASLNTGTGVGNVVIVQPDGKIDPAVLPNIAITDTFAVASQTAMLALTAEVGDVAVRTDISKTYILKASPAATLANWVELLFPGAPAIETSAATFKMDGTAAAGASGKVADAAHVHPSDTTKAPLASPALTGTPTAPTAATGTNTTQLATTAYVQQELAADLATVAPKMDGTAAVGTAAKMAREDHVHPTDTTRAPLASPGLTGTPTAPTAAATVNNTQIATTGFVNAFATSKGFLDASATIDGGTF